MNDLSIYLEKQSFSEVKLHLGCGGMRWKDFVNVDLHPFEEGKADSSRSGCVADVYADIRDLGVADNVVDEIFTSHTFEHFTRWEGLDMLQDWCRMMKPGGRLVIETPDFWRCVMWLFHPKKSNRVLGRNQFYGNQWDRLEFETHRYVWSANELKRACLRAGFEHVVVTHRTETHYPGRDMRILATK